MVKRQKKDSPKVKELKHQARRRSIKEGIFASMQASFGSYYIAPFAIAINASNSLVALFGSVAGLLGPLSQTFSSRLIEKHSRKTIVRHAVLLEALVWIPMILIGILFYKGLLVSILPLLLILLYAFFIIAANAAGPAWFSWMGDITDEQFRGRWFSKRNLLTGFVAFVLAIAASFFLDYFSTTNRQMFGFIILFGLAFLARIYSWHCFKYQYEPKIKLKKGYYFSFTDFLLKAPKNNFGRFALFRSALAFAGSISTPLLTVYLLRNLGFSYKTYMILILAGSIFALLFVELWGKFSDRFGNYKTIALTSIFIPLIPLLWILNPSPIYLFLVPSIVGGISWAGFNLAAGNFIYDNVSHDKRGIAVSYYNMTMGIGTFLGAGLGALLIKVITTTVIEPIIIIFLIGTFLRMIVVFIGIPKIKEIRKVEKITGSRAIEKMFLRELKPTIKEEIHQLTEIKSYIRS